MALPHGRVAKYVNSLKLVRAGDTALAKQAVFLHRVRSDMDNSEPAKVLFINPLRKLIAWRLYENLTVYISYLILPLAIIFCIDLSTPALGGEPMTGRYGDSFGYGAVIALVWTMIYDVALYALQRNEQNNPITKWLSLRCARFPQPDEVLIVSHEFSGDVTNGTKIRCEKCGVTHLFQPDETDSRMCPHRKFYRFCNAIVTSPFM